MIPLKLPLNAEKALVEMAEAAGTTVERIAFAAVMEAIEDWHDARIAEERLGQDDGVRIPLAEIVKDIEAREARELSAKPAAE
jgi:hypothetical protein